MTVSQEASIEAQAQAYEPEEPAEQLSYEEWIHTYFPNVARHPLAERHHRLWRWLDALKPGVKPPAHIGIWGRGGAKSSTAELGVAYVGKKLARRFVLYVSGTQDQANLHVQAVATLFEALDVPRLLSKYGNSKGWTQDRVRTATGFNVAAYGLDAALRGIKLDEFRPDLIVFDDIDSRDDSLDTIKKKEARITSSILPAGSADCAVLFIQNLIHDASIATRLVNGRAEFLLRRDPPVIEPAVRGLQTERVELEDGSRQYKIVGGEATWPGQSLETCEAQINEWGLPDFLREAQHEVQGIGGFYYNASNFGTISVEKFLEIVASGAKFKLVRAWDLAATFGGGDYTAGVLMAMFPNRVCYVIDVKRQQLDSKNVRELILTTAERDKRGEIWSPDEFGKSGDVVKPGRLLFTFKHKGVRIHLPQDPAQAGKDQAQQYYDLLSGHDREIKTVSGKKGVRGRGWADRVNGGNAYLIEGDWNFDYIEEHRQFKEDETHAYDDQCDASSDAHNDMCPPALSTSKPVVSQVETAPKPRREVSKTATVARNGNLMIQEPPKRRNPFARR